MTVPASQPLRRDYDGNGVTTTFTVDFRFLQDADLKVIRTVKATGVQTVLTLDSPGADGYTVSGAGQPSGGSVTLVTAPVGAGDTQEKVSILLEPVIEQETDYIANDPFSAETHERALDRLTLIARSFNEKLTRTLTLPESIPGSAATVPTPDPLKPLVWNEAGTALENGDTTLAGDLLLRTHLADQTAGRGSDLVACDATTSPRYLRTVSQMLQGLPVPITRWVDPTKLSAIRAGTSTYDASADINAAFAAYTNFTVPAGRYGIGAQTLSIPDGLSLLGDGWCSGLSGGSVKSPTGAVFYLLDGSDRDVFRQAGKATRYSFHIKGIAIDGNGTNQTSNPGPDGTYGIYQFNRNAFFLEALYNAVLEDVFWFNMRGGGFVAHGDPTAGCTNIFLKHCHGYNARTYNIYTEGALTDLRVFGGDYGYGRVANARFTSSCTSNDVVYWTSQCQDPADANTHINGTGAVTNGGIVIAGNNNKIIGGRIEGNAGHGIRCVGDYNKADGVSVYFNSATASTAGSFDGINDSGSGNNWSDCEIRQSTGSVFALRQAIRLEAAHTNTRIRACDLRRVAASGADAATPVYGLSFTKGDKSDFTWAYGEVKAYQGVGHSIGTSATKVQFRTETTDARNEWDTTSDNFTAAECGIYRIDTGVNLANATDGNSFIVAIYKNGTEYRRLGQQRAGAALAVQIAGGLEMKLEAGDVIDIRATAGTASNTNVGAALTWLEITQING